MELATHAVLWSGDHVSWLVGRLGGRAQEHSPDLIPAVRQDLLLAFAVCAGAPSIKRRLSSKLTPSASAHVNKCSMAARNVTDETVSRALKTWHQERSSDMKVL